MTYAAVINTFDPDCEAQAGRIMHFIKDAGLDQSDGTLVICSRLNGSIACLAGFARTIHIAAELCMPQTAAGYIKKELGSTDLFIMPGNMFGSELAVHLGSCLNGSSLTGVTSADICFAKKGGTMVVCRRIYANHVSGSFEMKREPFCISLDNSLPSDTVSFCQTANVAPLIMPKEDFCSGLRMEPLEMPADLDAAECVVIGGNGIGNRKNAEELSELAGAAGMIAAGSRPCVMNAWLPMNRMIGVSGRMIRPKVAILLGVSGSPAFYEGVKNSGRIIAVNRDPDAPISKKADLVIAGDCMDIFRRFTEKYTDRTNRA